MENKKPRLFYWEEEENCWAPAEGLSVENIISAESILRDGWTTDITFKRVDMTDEEFNAIPEG